MKTKLLFLMFFGQILFSYGQSIQIDKITSTAVSGGINVNLLITSFDVGEYLSHSYTITGNTINLSVCYYHTGLQLIVQRSNDFFIPFTNGGNYTVNVSTFNSLSNTVCDYFSNGPTASINFLSDNEFENQKDNLKLFPNPTSGRVAYNGDNIEVKTIKIFDNIGRLVKTITDGEIDFTELNEGIYFVKMETESNTFTQKIIVKK